jgi:hypothetical protein
MVIACTIDESFVAFQTALKESVPWAGSIATVWAFIDALTIETFAFT